jgi:hypothetical protein
MRTHSRIMKNIFGLLVSTILVFSVHQVYGAEFRAEDARKFVES